MENNKDYTKELVKTALSALDNKKAEDIKILDISEISTIADYFIIAGGNSKPHVQTLCDEVLDQVAKLGGVNKKTEGYETANWVLMDFNDVIVHIFDKENRLFYDLERIWKDVKSMDISEFGI